jgi:soluble lytic murein transglycosylase-like protein
MINEQRKGRPFRKRLANKPQHSVWFESDKKGGFLIFAGVKGTEIKTYAGSATSRSTLDYNIRKAKSRFGLPID